MDYKILFILLIILILVVVACTKMFAGKVAAEESLLDMPNEVLFPDY
jgi:hypothetical protein